MRLVVITHARGERGHLEVARAALSAGCRFLQLRDKDMDDRGFMETAVRMKRMCMEAGAVFTVNDRVDVAEAVGCDGVHLGSSDIDPASARRLLGPLAIIGYSPESLEDAAAAVAAGADYLGVGPVFETRSKPDAGEPIGLEGLGNYCKLGLAPVIAVGGVNAGNAGRALAAGAAGVAVLSAVFEAEDMVSAVAGLLDARLTS